MSLNRIEQMVSDYVQGHPEEKHFWEDKVRKVAALGTDGPSVVAALERELRAYFDERSQVVPRFKEVNGLQRVSLRNLVEYWLRLWVAPRPKPKPVDPNH
ncbi:MAG: hypothetical protein ABSE59_04205 [Opitutaceae bacterium]|jgi:hypothetical protein